MLNRQLNKIKNKTYKKRNKFFKRSSYIVTFLIILSLTLLNGVSSVTKDTNEVIDACVSVDMFTNTSGSTQYRDISNVLISKYKDDPRIDDISILYKAYDENYFSITGALEYSEPYIYGVDTKYNTFSTRTKTDYAKGNPIKTGSDFDNNSQNEVIISSRLIDYLKLDSQDLIGKTIDLDFNNIKVSGITIKGVYNSWFFGGGNSFIFSSDVINKVVLYPGIVYDNYHSIVVNGISSVTFETHGVDDTISLYDEIVSSYPNTIDSNIRNVRFIQGILSNAGIIIQIVSIFLVIIALINLIVNNSRFLEEEKDFLFFLRRLGLTKKRILLYTSSSNIFNIVKSFIISLLIISIICFAIAPLYNDFFLNVLKLENVIILPPYLILIAVLLVLCLLVVLINYILLQKYKNVLDKGYIEA